MRLDAEHVRKIAKATTKTRRGTKEIKFDIAFMAEAMDRLNLWERGLLMQALLKAGESARPTAAQRALLALFVYGGDK